MKRGYKRLLIFELIVFMFLILNSFVWNILSGYKISIFILIALIFFKYLFGFEKDRHRYTKDLIMEVIIFLIIFFILYYLLGIVITFYQTGNYYTFEGLTKFIAPVVIYVIMREYLRYMIMAKADGSKLLFITTVLLFTTLDITNAIYAKSFSSVYQTFLFIALTIIPAISLNTVFSYFTLKTGYKPLIIYSIIIGIYMYLVPIAPNPNEYITSVVDFILPILLGYRFYLFFKKEPKTELDRDYKKKNFLPLVLSSLIIIVIVYFTSGYFHYWAIAVASGSMSPKINKGDVAIIEKVNSDSKELKKGQVIAFKYEDKIVVHRLIDIIDEQDGIYFYTKGDANSKPDNFVVKEKMIIGVVNHKIPYLGIPTVWINELL